jgi:hypothetical protein
LSEYVPEAKYHGYGKEYEDSLSMYLRQNIMDMEKSMRIA